MSFVPISDGEGTAPRSSTVNVEAEGEDRKDRPPDFKDVALQAHGGMEAVRKMEPRPSKGTMVRACIELRQTGHEKKAIRLFTLVDEFYPNRRGRNIPNKGQQRDYKIQQQAGVDFVRIPTKYLGLRKGQKVRALSVGTDAQPVIKLVVVPPAE